MAHATTYQDSLMMIHDITGISMKWKKITLSNIKDLKVLNVFLVHQKDDDPRFNRF